MALNYNNGEPFETYDIEEKAGLSCVGLLRARAMSAARSV